MKLCIPLFIALLSLPAVSDDFMQGTAAQSGLSGFPFLPVSNVLHTGFLRIQGRIEYSDIQHNSGSTTTLPLCATWGMRENIELGCEIPLYINDSAFDGDVLGDISAGCSWLYETARGGTNLVLSGIVRIPTGTEGRDRGSELGLGFSTSTTFRLLRCHTSATYVLAGGSDPFSGPITDYLRFSAGGASFLTGNLQVVGGVEGNTMGTLDLAGTLVSYAFDNIALFGTLRAGLSGGTTYSLSAGLAWTGSGF